MFKKSLSTSGLISVVVILLVNHGAIQAVFGCCSRVKFAARHKFLLEQAQLAAEMGSPKWGQDPRHPLTRAQVDAAIAARTVVPVVAAAPAVRI